MYRYISEDIKNALKAENPTIILILGLRQTGKTTLAKAVCLEKGYQMFNFDLLSDRREFERVDRHSLADFAERYKDKVILIDEVQKMPEATSIIKHLFDNYKLRFVLTGSSELKIRKNFGDTLAGRTKVFHLYPLSIKELLTQERKIKETENPSLDLAQIKLQKYLVFGSLPNIENIKPEEYALHLKNFAETLLSKDVLEISGIKKSTKLYGLAKLLAWQVGQLVNVNEVAMLAELSRPTVYSYLDILEQMNIISRAHAVSINERKAISEKFKVYFTDLGVRNALINNFENLQTRLDIGALLENAVYMGIKRQLDYEHRTYKMGFFRSKTGSEIDIVAQYNGKTYLYEVKTSDRFQRKKGVVSYITKSNAWKYL
ncbi:MAG TPA: ATP-binding protein [Candidatus Paceibacterota bacterium]